MKFFTKVKFVLAAFIVMLILVFFMAFNSFGIDADTIYTLQGEMDASTYNSARGYAMTGNTIQGLFASITEEEDEDSNLVTGTDVDDGSSTWTGETVNTTLIPTIPTPVNTDIPSPLYKQSDSRWAEISYGSSDIGNVGCFPTALAMIVEHLTGNTTTPDVVAEWIKGNVPNYYAGGTSWTAVPLVCSNYGLQCTEGQVPVPVTKEGIQECLDAGGCIMFRSSKGWFTGGGHGMCILGYAGDREHVYVNNPSNSGGGSGCPAGNGSSYNDAYAFSIDELVAELSNGKGNIWTIYK